MQDGVGMEGPHVQRIPRVALGAPLLALLPCVSAGNGYAEVVQDLGARQFTCPVFLAQFPYKNEERARVVVPPKPNNKPVLLQLGGIPSLPSSPLWYQVQVLGVAHDPAIHPSCTVVETFVELTGASGQECRQQVEIAGAVFVRETPPKSGIIVEALSQKLQSYIIAQKAFSYTVEHQLWGPFAVADIQSSIAFFAQIPDTRKVCHP